MTANAAGKMLYLCPGGAEGLVEIARQLGHYGYLSRLFDGAAELLTAAAETPPDVVLLDCGSGLDEASRGALSELAARVPLACISNDGTVTARLDAVRMGGQAYFTRPLDMTSLLDTLDRMTAPPQANTGKVLIVDDSRALANFYAAHLGEAGFACQIVTDPLKTLDALEESTPDLILLDMNMPGASGQEIARIIRQQDAFLSIPIVFISAETDLDLQREAMSLGGDEFLQKPIEPAHLISAVKNRVLRYRALRALMLRDSLTGLLNHSTFKERLRAETARATRQDKPLSVALIDIDHFKNVNDQYGHPVGDRVIKNISRLLRQRLRGADVIGRYGGEEFAVALSDTPLDKAVSVIDQIRATFAAIEQRAGNTGFHATFSAGVAQCPPLTDSEALIKAADEALYAAKRGGRDQVRAADDVAA